MKSKLALLGGKPIRDKNFPSHPIIGEEEKQSVMEVLNRGELSTFIAAPGKYFLGGKKIKEFEQIFADYHDCKYAVSFNSATAALHAAVVAVGVGPGEEVIVPPYTFTSTATCALMNNSIPVFADVQDDIFCLDPRAVIDNISQYTKAIIPVHLFGHPADMEPLMKIAQSRNLKVIEDCAQAPGARYKGKPVGTIGDCGIFSFTENKNITTGEGGMLITNDQAIAEAARMVRNHGEAIWEGQTARTYTSTMLGWNYRMTEMEAALGIVQFKRMDYLNSIRIELSNYLSSKLKLFPGLSIPMIYPNCLHVFYAYAIKYDKSRIGVSRDNFVKALNAEGIPFGAGYVKPLYLSPIYHDAKPLAFKIYQGKAKYNKGLCPITEKLHEEEIIVTVLTRPPAEISDMEDIVNAFEKIYDNLNYLK
jgi:perosamine synthetase